MSLDNRKLPWELAIRKRWRIPRVLKAHRVDPWQDRERAARGRGVAAETVTDSFLIVAASLDADPYFLFSVVWEEGWGDPGSYVVDRETKILIRKRNAQCFDDEYGIKAIRLR